MRIYNFEWKLRKSGAILVRFRHHKIALICLSLIGLIYVNFTLHRNSSKHEVGSRFIGNRTKIKRIQLWTKGWSGQKYPIEGWDINEDTLKSCSFKCTFTNDQSLLDVSDAVVYHGVNWNLGEIFGLSSLPNRRTSFDQIWTFLRLESPAIYKHNFKAYDNQFNWTATYRWDSDVPYLYGKFEKILHSEKPMLTPTERSTRKKHLVAWMVSNCNAQSRREQIVEKLKQFIPIHTYGKCSSNGRLDCPGENCYATLSKKYKFYLSFENALCQDYLTEKFYLPLYYGMVPVLYAHESVTKFIPRKSYINVTDFETIQALAKYLIYLDENDEEYLKYFEWKNDFRVNRNADDMFWCSFCKRLNGNVTRKVYSSIHNWFYYNDTSSTAGQQCIAPSVFY